MVIILAINGCLSLYYRSYNKNLAWRTAVLRNVGKVHRYLGYGIFILSQLAVATGIYTRFDNRDQDEFGYILIGTNLGLWFVIMSVFEANHQRILRREVPFNN